MSKYLYIIRGVSGSGKTTVGESITFATFSADQYFENQPDGYATWSRELLSEAHEYCRKNVEDAMKNGLSKIAVTNTFTRSKEFRPYELLAQKYGYQVFHMIIETRHGNKDVHNVPKSALEEQEFWLRQNIQLSQDVSND